MESFIKRFNNLSKNRASKYLEKVITDSKMCGKVGVKWMGRQVNNRGNVWKRVGRLMESRWEGGWEGGFSHW